jgi:hypothetical protein
VIFAILVLTDGRTSFDTDLVKSMGWWSAIPGLVGALVISYFVPLQLAQRIFTRLAADHADRRTAHPRLLAEVLLLAIALS